MFWLKHCSSQAPPCDLPLTFVPDPRKASRRKTASKEDERDQLRNAHELTVHHYNKIRFKLPLCVMTAQVKAAAEAEADGAELMDVDDAEGDGDDGLVLLRLNYDSFAKCFRHQACIDMITERFGRACGTVRFQFML